MRNMKIRETRETRETLFDCEIQKKYFIISVWNRVRMANPWTSNTSMRRQNRLRW